MSYCPECGTLLDATTRFCPTCGRQALLPRTPAVASPAVQPPPAPAAPAEPAQRSNNNVLVALIAVAVVVLALVGGGLWLVNRHGHYPEAVRTTFLQSCQSTGGNYSTCTCALDKLEAKYSFTEYKRLETRMVATGDLPPEVSDVVADCR